MTCTICLHIKCPDPDACEDIARKADKEAPAED